jgi:peroxiredoxin Q/BCP
MTEIRAGTAAPSFELVDADEKKVALKDLKGQWVVLYFYPKDDTPGCTKEACEFTTGIKAFEKLDATVLGVSADSPESHRKFIAKYRLKVRLLSDPDRTVIKQYGAWGKKNMYGKISEGLIRSTVLINPEGNVEYHWAKVKAEGHAEQVRVKLTELRGS